ncbi:MAG: glycosyltransferase family 4 protein [Nitrospirota bacterium]
MRILHTEASTGWGGQEIRILKESLGMRARGHEVFILAGPDSQLLKRARQECLHTDIIQFRRRDFSGIFTRVKRYIETKQIEVVNTHSSKDSWLILPAARLARTRPLAVRTRHLSTPIGRNPLSSLLYNCLPHIVITTGEAIRTQMIEVNKFNPVRIMSIPTGVDLEAFDPSLTFQNLRDELGLGHSIPLIGTVSVIRSWKGLDYLVKALPLIMKEIPEARLVITGEGPHRPVLEKTIESTGTGKNVFLLGHREDIVPILSSIDVMVQPSYANEGVPQTILQALAMKKPVIASDLLPFREVIRDGETGMLVPVRDSDCIAQAVIKALGDRDFSRRLGESGRRLVETSYSFTGMLDRLELLYGSYQRKEAF